MVSKNNDSTETNWLEIETCDDWVSTPHDSVYLRDKSPTVMGVSTTNLIKAGALVAEELPGDWTVIVTAGPYRSSQVSYESNLERQRIHLDFYSVRPGYRYLNEIIEDVKRAFDDESNGQTGVSV